MAGKKYAKYITTEGPLPPPLPEQDKYFEDQRKSGNYLDWIDLPPLDSNIIKGAFFMGGCTFTKQHGDKPVQIEVSHSHNWDEAWIFLGTMPDKPKELGGEIDFWLEDELYTVTKPCTVWIPKGMKHCPLIFKKMDHPIIHLAVGNGTTYSCTNYEKWEYPPRPRV